LNGGREGPTAVILNATEISSPAPILPSRAILLMLAPVAEQ